MLHSHKNASEKNILQFWNRIYFYTSILNKIYILLLFNIFLYQCVISHSFYLTFIIFIISSVHYFTFIHSHADETVQELCWLSVGGNFSICIFGCCNDIIVCKEWFSEIQGSDWSKSPIVIQFNSNTSL